MDELGVPDCLDCLVGADDMLIERDDEEEDEELAVLLVAVRFGL